MIPQIHKQGIVTQEKDGLMSKEDKINLDKLIFEEGSWTPVMNGATVEYTMQKGLYKKIGNIVFFTFAMRGKITAVAETKYSRIDGLPYSCKYYGGTGSISEYAYCLEHTTDRPTTLRVYEQSVSIQRGDTWEGTTADEWKICNLFYLHGGGFYFVD